MIGLISAPSNLGLRPPQPGSVPGTAKAPEALGEAGLHRRLLALGAVDAGTVLPGRYVDDDATRPPRRLRNETALLDHAHRLAARTAEVVEQQRTPVVLGGDCSLLVAAGLAMRGVGRGLVHVDGHTDFRHPGNSDRCGSLAGEDLADAVGLHWSQVADLDGAGPAFDAARTAHIGCRDDDEHLAEARAVLAGVVPAAEVVRAGPPAAAGRARRAAGGTSEREGFWVQLDVDVLDPVHLSAVDSPDFPKGTNLSRWSAEDLEAVAHALNTRPARLSHGRHLPKPSTSTYARCKTPVLHPPVECGQYTSIALTDRFLEASIDASVGATGSSYDNALAETINGLYKTELIRPRGPWRTIEQVEIATLEWVDWFNHRRIAQHCDDLTSVEFEHAHYRQNETWQPGAHLQQ